MSGASKGPLIAIVGPTAVGKTALSLRLAKDLGGEVVAADSRQIYRHMDVGTAKPTAEERREVRHHLLDVAEPDEEFTLALYQRMALGAIDDILERGRLPMLVGGTGLYVRAVTENLRIPRVAPHPEWRREWEELARAHGSEALHERLREVDPLSAERIDPRNVRRVARALEVRRATGRPFSQETGARESRYRVRRIGLTVGRARLYERIERRADLMMKMGLLDEVRELLDRGYSSDLPAMSGLGYRQLVSHLRGEVSLEEAVRQIKRDTRRYVQQQHNWFRPSDERIAWFDAEATSYEEIRNTVDAFLAGSGAGPHPE